jgi:hypothetical protein
LDNENKERRESLIPSPARDSQIQVVVNQTHDDSEMEIDLVRVFHNMKLKLRIFAWVILLCLALGICAPLLMYQFTKAPLTVSSVVTLRYDVLRRDAEGRIISSTPVKDLTAPEGGELDLNQITASYVLQAAMEGLELSHPVSLANLRSNIRIDRILTENSRRQQEIASQMLSDKNARAYSEVQNIELTYVNQFVVSLTNGFGEPNSRGKYELKDGELRLILDRILSAYNDYLVITYADTKLPDDEFAAIDIERQDILESLDLLRSAVQHLYDFCDEQPEGIQNYRSWKTGITLTDLMAELETARSINVDYLYSYVSTNSIVRDRDAMITSYRYQLRNAQTQLDALIENIQTNQDILDDYHNDEIFVSMQDSDTSKSTKTTTDYYNRLIMEQADNYEKVAKLEVTIADLQYKLNSLTDNGNESAGAAEQEKAAAELAEALRVCRSVYAQIRDQFSEIHGASFFTTYAEHTVSQGKTASFLSAASKKMLIGGAAGLVIACGLWFLSALAIEFQRRKDEDGEGKEAEKG